MKWELVNPYGIEPQDAPGGTFHGGRIIDVLIANVAELLAASRSSGVWLVNRSTSAAIPGSMLWDNANVQCLAHDAVDHVYAGCGSDYSGPASEFLYETDRSKPYPYFADWLPVPLPAEITAVHDIVVVGPQERHVVLATNDGLYGSPVPPVGSPYIWQQASGSDSTEFFSVCAGPDGRVVAGTMYPNIAAGVWPLYTSNIWDGVLTPAVSGSLLPGDVDRGSLGRTTVDSCASTLGMFVYALSVDSEGTPVCVMRSTDGGLS